VRSIPQETRNRVIEAAAKFDYRPSFYARSLRKRQTFSIGVLVPDLNDHYATQVLSGVEELLMEEGYFYLTASHRRKPDLIEEYPRLLLDRCVEGFILIDTVLEHSHCGRGASQVGRRDQRGSRSASRRRALSAPPLPARPSPYRLHARRQP
jgi:DNA-binding LacI/PurR family transcriptional regulator